MVKQAICMFFLYVIYLLHGPACCCVYLYSPAHVMYITLSSCTSILTASCILNLHSHKLLTNSRRIVEKYIDIWPVMWLDLRRCVFSMKYLYVSGRCVGYFLILYINIPITRFVFKQTSLHKSRQRIPILCPSKVWAYAPIYPPLSDCRWICPVVKKQ